MPRDDSYEAAASAMGRGGLGMCMDVIAFPALRAFDYDGATYAQGDPVAVSPVVATILARRGDISLLDRMARPRPQTRVDASDLILKSAPPPAVTVSPKTRRRRHPRRTSKP